MNISLELQPCLKNKSGIGIYTHELAKKLQAYNELELKGHIFNFVNRNDLSKDIEGLNFSKQVCILLPYGVYRRIWNYIPIKYNWLFKKKTDITHFFNFIVPPRIEGKVINTIHDLTFMYYPETMDPKNLKRIKNDIDYSIERADKIIAVSNSTKCDLMKELDISNDKIAVIYPAVHHELFSHKHDDNQINAAVSKYKLPLNYILYIGTLEPRKNIETLIESFALFKSADAKCEHKLVIAGKKGWLYESIFERVEKLGIKDKVIFTGYIDEEDKPIIYQLASVFVFPSIYEGFGIPVLEAMAAGVPVITSNVSSLPEVAGDAAILVDPKDVERIAKGMEELINNQELREELIKKGRIQAQKFSWEKSAEKLYKVYQSLM